MVRHLAFPFALLLAGCPTAVDDDSTLSDDVHPIDDDNSSPADDDTTPPGDDDDSSSGDDDSGDDDSTPWPAIVVGGWVRDSQGAPLSGVLVSGGAPTLSAPDGSFFAQDVPAPFGLATITLEAPSGARSWLPVPWRSGPPPVVDLHFRLPMGVPTATLRAPPSASGPLDSSSLSVTWDATLANAPPSVAAYEVDGVRLLTGGQPFGYPYVPGATADGSVDLSVLPVDDDLDPLTVAWTATCTNPEDTVPASCSPPDTLATTCSVEPFALLCSYVLTLDDGWTTTTFTTYVSTGGAR